MLNRYLALALAVIGCIMTILVGVSRDIRPMTIGYRSFISSLVLGAGGYLLGNLVESFQQRMAVNVNPKGQSIDIRSTEEIAESEEEAAKAILPGVKVPTTSEFRAFTSDNFDHVSGQ